MYPTISDDPSIQSHYELCRSRGTSHKLAEMFAFQEGPGLDTDTTFMAGRNEDPAGEGWDHKTIGEVYRQKARKAGVSPSGKTYLGTLARYPGDPEAWVSGKGDVKRVVERRGWNCDGAVKHKSPDRPLQEDGPYRVNEKVLEREVKREARKIFEETGHKLTPKERTELKETTRTRVQGNT